MTFLRNLSLSNKILLGILPIFLLFVSVSVVLQNHFQEQVMMEEAQNAAVTYASLIKESMVTMMVNDLKVDSTFLHRINVLQQFDSVHIHLNALHLRDEVLAPERRSEVAERTRIRAPRDSLENSVFDSGEPYFLHEGDRFRAIVPFSATQVCQKCHAVPLRYTLAAVDMEISLARISEAARDNWDRSLIIFLCFTVLVVLVASLMFTRLMSAPIDRLVRATSEIASGQLDHEIPRLPRSTGNKKGRDELKTLAAKFDQMRLALKEKIRMLDEANRNLSERNREIETALELLRQAQEDLVRSERLAVTGRMTAQLSHEINNPIHNIQSLLESSLRRMQGHPEVRDLVAVALEEVMRLAKLTRQMLDFYRGSVVPMELEPVDLAGLIDEVVSTHRAQMAQRLITLETAVGRGLPPVPGSRDKLKQVLLNLLMNAADAISGSGTVRFVGEQAGPVVRIKVQDNGCGIPEEILGRIFDAFFTTKKEVSGVGLGLFVCYGIIQQHNGKINVTSKVGEGTTFTIELPAQGEAT